MDELLDAYRAGLSDGAEATPDRPIRKVYANPYLQAGYDLGVYQGRLDKAWAETDVKAEQVADLASRVAALEEWRDRFRTAPPELSHRLENRNG